MPRQSRKDISWADVFEDPTRVANQALLVLRYFRRWETSRRHENSLVSVTIYPPEARRIKWLVVAKRGISPYREVAFYQSASPFTALLGLFNAIATGSIEWKADAYDQGARPRRD